MEAHMGPGAMELPYLERLVHNNDSFIQFLLDCM